MLPLSPSIGMLELMLVLVAGVSLELALTRWLTRHAPGHARRVRLWHGLGAPLLCSAVIVAAVFGAYPALFGFRAAPALPMLMDEGATLVGGLLLVAICLARLLAPLLPTALRSGLLDSMQAMGASALVFSWFASDVGAGSAHPWPGALGALSLLGLACLLPPLASGLGADLGARLDARRGGRGLEQWFGQAMGMVAVAPIVILYGYLLGMQLGM